MKFLAFVFAAMIVAGSAFAGNNVEVRACADWEQNMVFIKKPWKDNYRELYNGRVDVVNIDTLGEPACCPAKILVYMPNKDAELGEPKCLAVSQKGGMGYMAIDFKGATFRYVDGKGVRVDFPYSTYGDGSGDYPKGNGYFYINLAKETITLE